MIGRRCTADPTTVRPDEVVSQPGDYWGPVMGFTGGIPAVFFRLPIAADPGAPAQATYLHHVCSPPHRFVEEPDGTLSIYDSIACGQPWYWHGFLEKGVWRLA